MYIYAALGIVVGGGGEEQRGKVDIPQQRGECGKSQARIQKGGGQGFPDPPGKSSQVIWGSIGNKKLDPLPGKSRTLPPSPGKSWTPCRTLKK